MLQRQPLGSLTPFKFNQYVRDMGAENRRQRELASEQKRQKRAMWTMTGIRPLAEPPVLYLNSIMDDIGSDRRFKNLWENDPGKVCRMKDLVSEGRVLSDYNDWTIEMQMDAGVSGVTETTFLEISCPEGQFYCQLRVDLTIEQDVVREEWRELSSTANPLGLFELLYLDNDGGTTRIKALWEAGQTLGYEYDSEVQSVYGAILDEYALVRFEKWQLDEDGETKELERCIREGDWVAGWDHPRVQEKYGYLAVSGAAPRLSYRETGHLRHGGL